MPGGWLVVISNLAALISDAGGEFLVA